MNTKDETMGSIHEQRYSSARPAVFAALGLWLGLVIFLGSQEAFVGSAGSPPLPIFLGVAIPMTVFFSAYFGWGAFRSFILGADIRLVAAIQGWRWAGLGFLTLYSYGILPALFALPAGLGDMAIGFTAPWMVLKLIKRPLFATDRQFVMWNIFGIVDFVVALSMGTLCSGAFSGITRLIGDVSTSPMARLPLVLIPAFMVPFFMMLHFTALFQARHWGEKGFRESC